MNAGDLTCTVTFRRRSWFRRLLTSPRLVHRNYRTFRRDGVGRLIALYGAWLLATSVVTFGSQSHEGTK